MMQKKNLQKSKPKKTRNNILKSNKEAKEKLFKKYKFNPEIKAISKLTEIFVKWQDQRKIYTLTFVTLQSKILAEISKRTGISYNILRYINSKEIKGILEGKFNIADLEERKKSSLFVYRNGEIVSIISGYESEKFTRKVSHIETGNVKEIKGMVASLGIAKGRIKIIMSAKNIDKVKEGDILVAPMTRPEHLLGMKKAAAIVTDDGGITCHAAIVSREFGEPGIIGTRVATKVLKDGDLVEVDANKGIVKILKKN